MKEFETDSFHYTLIDTPGHRDFVHNTMHGMCQADVGILVVPAPKGEFEWNTQRWDHRKGLLEGGTLQNIKLLHSLGVKQLIVCVNKMDNMRKTSGFVKYSKDRFLEVAHEIQGILDKKSPFEPFRIPIIPISAFSGDMLTEPPENDNMKWWKGFEVERIKVIINRNEMKIVTFHLFGAEFDDENIDRVIYSYAKDHIVKGKTLLDALERLPHVSSQRKKLNKKPALFLTEYLYRIRGVGRVVTGLVLQGKVNENPKFQDRENFVANSFKSMESWNKEVKMAKTGDR
eukprot:UN33990